MNVKKIKRERGDKKMGIMDKFKEKWNKQMEISKQKNIDSTFNKGVK